MTGSRMRRVDEAIREVLGQAIVDEIQDPRLGFVTVTGVDTSPDLKHSKVYVSVLGDEDATNDSLDALQSAHGRLQSALAGQLRLKHTPELRFLYDDSVDRGMRVDAILDHEDEDAE